MRDEDGRKMEAPPTAQSPRVRIPPILRLNAAVYEATEITMYRYTTLSCCYIVSHLVSLLMFYIEGNGKFITEA